MPTPTSGVSDALNGVFGLLLPMMMLCSSTVHSRLLRGQRPSCGGGASSLLSEFGATPLLLPANSEFRMTSRPPALVPEKPSAELVATSWDSKAWHTRWQAPT